MVKLDLTFLKKKKEKSNAKPKCADPETFEIASSGQGITTLSINCEGCSYKSSIEDPDCREQIIDKLVENPANKIILDRGFYRKEYTLDEARMLREVARASDSIKLWRGTFRKGCGSCGEEKKLVHDIMKDFIKRDPIGAYLELDEIKKKRSKKHPTRFPECEKCHRYFLENIDVIRDILGETKLIKEVIEKNLMESIGIDFRTKEGKIIDIHREAYKELFKPLVVPFFSAARLESRPPAEAEFIKEYETGGANIKLYNIPSTGEGYYFISPPEYKLQYNINKLKVLREAYDELLEEAPKIIESRDAQHAEEKFKLLCRNKIIGAASKGNLLLSGTEINEMVDMLVRCMMGLDIIEILLQDSQLQDVYINSPVESIPVYVKHAEYDDCKTNIYLTDAATKNIVSKFRLKSGRAFSEISPILDMELPEFGTRVNITGPPISPDGLAFAFRRSSDTPWTLFKFILNRMISPFAAGLMGFMVNEESTILMCGDRGSGKTSILTALISAMPMKNRILTVEDTFELPVPALTMDGGFRIQRMKVKPPTSGEASFEMSTEDAMRSILRMGDSAIIMGEVRGPEAKVLYEAMNVGGSGNCVLGTIHGKNARNMFERVVFSLGVPPQSFKATDIIILASRVRPHGGSKKLRRVIGIVEVGKTWLEPNPEYVFKNLMEYNSDTDALELCDALKNPETSEIIQSVAKKRGTDPKDVLESIKCRAKVYGHVTDAYTELKEKGTDLPDLLEVATMTFVNNMFISAVNEDLENTGTVNYENVYDVWEKKFEKYVKLLIKKKEQLEKDKTKPGEEEKEKPKEEAAEDLETQILEIVDPEEEEQRRVEEERRRLEEEEQRRKNEEKRRRKEEGTIAGIPSKKKSGGTVAGIPSKKKPGDASKKKKKGVLGRFRE